MAPLSEEQCGNMRTCGGAGSQPPCDFILLAQKEAAFNWGELEIKDKEACFLKVVVFKIDVLRQGALSSNKIPLRS